MKKYSFTLYKLRKPEKNFDEYCCEIISKYNKTIQDEHKKYELRSNKEVSFFQNIRNYRVYSAVKDTTPEWKNFLEELVDDLPSIKNISYSYVMFLEYESKIFAVTGGKGYLVIQEYKDNNFGLELLSKILDPNDPVIKQTTDRYLSGNRIGAKNYFLNYVSLNSESSISNFFKSIVTFFTKKQIEEIFGIPIDYGRNEYKFDVKDSIKLGKELNIKELDIFIKKISHLLDGKTKTKINFFHEVNSSDPLFDELNKIFEEEIMRNAQSNFNEIVSNFHISNLRTDCDTYNIIKKNTDTLFCSFKQSLNFNDIISLFNEKFKTKIIYNPSKSIIQDFFKQLKVVGYIENEEVDNKQLLDIVEYTTLYKNNKYWFIDGKWYYIDEQFIDLINQQFSIKVTPKVINENISLELKDWAEGIDEGQYSYSYNEIENVFVLDRILVDNIELCDLLVINESDLYLIHIKDKLDREMRVLSQQIIAAMTAINNSIHVNDMDFFRRYYRSIIRKIKESESESTLSKSARKVKQYFSTEESFVDLFLKYKLNFVFAFRPLSSQRIIDPSTINSTPAKIAMINLIESAKAFDFNLEFIQINRVDEPLKVS